MFDKCRTLFVVDDDPALRTSLLGLASSMGLACETFAAAESFLRRFDPALDGCLIIDLQMDAINGVPLQEQLLCLGSTLPVIVVTSCANIPAAVRAMQNGAVTVLEKPCDTDQFEQAIRAALNGGYRTRALCREQTDLRRRFERLEPRQREALALIVHGLPNKAIARELGVSMRTVDRIRAGLFETMGAQSAVELAGMAGELWRLPHGAAQMAMAVGEVA